jgi:hypothetical protein
LHYCNYKTILVDSTDWIYCELFDCPWPNTNDNVINYNDNCILLLNHILNEFTFDTFNVFMERCLDERDGSKQQSTYIQVDISKSIKNVIDNFENVVNNKSLSKTMRLNQIYSDLESEKLINKLNICRFKVLNMGCPYLFMTNNNNKYEMRVDVVIEIVPFVQENTNDVSRQTVRFQSKQVVLVLIGDNLFHYKFLYVGLEYLLYTENLSKIIKFKTVKRRVDSSPSQMIHLNETIKIVNLKDKG